MGRKNSRLYEKARQKVNFVAASFVAAIAFVACTAHVKIEPSDKPFIVNLNVKIDHDIRVKIEDQNKDLINLEDQVLDNKATKAAAAKKKAG